MATNTAPKFQGTRSEDLYNQVICVIFASDTAQYQHPMSKYINPFVDFGFKYIFGREESKPLLIDFLNALFCDMPDYSPIVDLQYLDKEKSRNSESVRGVIYDIHCETSNGKRFTVEMQNQSQHHFIDRIIYYSSKAVVDQGRPGRDWRYQFLPVYCVSLMNFTDERFGGKLRTDAALMDMADGKQISDKLRYIFIQTPIFGGRTQNECDTHIDRWLYNLINMKSMDRIAFANKGNVFEQLDEMAAYANLSPADRLAYDTEVKAYRDMRGQLEYAEDRGLARGRAEGKLELIRQMLKNGLPIETVAKIAEMTVDKIKHLVQNP